MVNQHRIFAGLVVSLLMISSVYAAPQQWGKQPSSPESYASAFNHEYSWALAYSGKKWEELSPQEQEALRRKKEKYDALSPAEKERLQKARDQYKKLPDDKREKLRKKWEKMSPEEKKRYKLEKGHRN